MELYEKLAKLQWLMLRYQGKTRRQKGPMSDPLRGQGRVLAILRLQPSISTKDLSYLLGIRPQSLNELLQKLERRGFIERVPSEADRRVLLVQLTELGKTQEPTSFDFDIFASLSTDEQTRLGEYLDRIITALEEEVFDDSDLDAAEEWYKEARGRISAEMFGRLGSVGRSRRHHGGSRPDLADRPAGPGCADRPYPDEYDIDPRRTGRRGRRRGGRVPGWDGPADVGFPPAERRSGRRRHHSDPYLGADAPMWDRPAGLDIPDDHDVPDHLDTTDNPDPAAQANQDE